MYKEKLKNIKDLKYQIERCDFALESISRILQYDGYAAINMSFYTYDMERITLPKSKLVELEVNSCLQRIKNSIQEAKTSYEKELNRY